MIYRNKRELLETVITSADCVLDVGFWGQGIQLDNARWPHSILQKSAREVWGIDLAFDQVKFPTPRYRMLSAENFDIPTVFDVIFAGDLIEHLSNPGLFLQSCRRNLKPGGTLILTTPNCFNLFSIAEKFSKREPTVNADHTCYFNTNTLRQLLKKNGMAVERFDYIYSLEYDGRESWKKRFLNILYWAASVFTDKFIETLVATARVEGQDV